MAEMMTTDVRALLDRQPFDQSAVADLREVLGRDPSRYRTLRDAVAAMKERDKGAAVKPDTHLRLGVGEVMLGRYQSGMGHLAKADGVGLAHYFRGLALVNLQRWNDAAAAFAEATAKGFDPKVSELHRVGALRRGNKIDAARTLLGTLDKAAGSAEYHYQRGSLLAADGELAPAAVEFEKAISLDRDHTGALFELAYINDLHGNDETAVDYYKRCTARPPVPLAALINLGVLYEDEMRFREAESCYRQVLAFDPNHPRARLFFRDCRASKDMYYDEEAEVGIRVLKQLLEIPVTDFELSVRSRNCLRKMNIRTLGDLTRTTEAALLASKNFGETSLQEIKEMMTSKGLRLGLALEGGERAANDLRVDPVEELSQEEKAILAKPISDLNLSVRARKCMTKLGIQTVGELMSRSGDDLMECKNFGVTSLNEVREKLTEIGLKLKNE